MIACRVQAQFNRQGEPRPKALLWGGTWLTVVDYGRRWKKEGSQYMLVRTTNNDVFQLCYNGQGWQGERISSSTHFA